MTHMSKIERAANMHDTKISARDVQVYYGENHAIKDVNVEIEDKTVTAFIGPPSGCGKSTFLRCLNRMNDTIDICKVTGDILLDGEDIYDKRVDPVQLRAKVGMVFQKPNPFPPKSIYDNVPMGRAFMGWPRTRPSWTRSLRNPCGVAPFGTRSRTVWTRRAPGCPVASSSACASPAPSRPNPRSY